MCVKQLFPCYNLLRIVFSSLPQTGDFRCLGNSEIVVPEGQAANDYQKNLPENFLGRKMSGTEFGSFFMQIILLCRPFARLIYLRFNFTHVLLAPLTISYPIYSFPLRSSKDGYCFSILVGERHSLQNVSNVKYTQQR